VYNLGVDDPPACLACGTCCFSRLETYVPVTGDDHARLGEHAERLVVFHGNRAFLRMEDGHCAALHVDTAANAFVCTVYDQRPETCRALARGSAECHGELAAKRDRPIAALVRARRV
jgi:uncharacterized protein